MIDEAVDEATAELREENERLREKLANARLEAREKIERVERIAWGVLGQFKSNAAKKDDSIGRFGKLMDRVVRVEQRQNDGGDEPKNDRTVDRGEFIQVHRAYQDVRDGVAGDLDANVRRAGRLFKDALERGEKSLGKLKYDSEQARTRLENVDDMTKAPSGKAKTVSRALHTLAIMSKHDGEDAERLFEFKKPSDDGVSSVRVVADLDDVKQYLDHVEALVDDVATRRLRGADEPDEADGPDPAGGGGDRDDGDDVTAAEAELDAVLDGEHDDSIPDAGVDQRDVSEHEVVATTR